MSDPMATPDSAPITLVHQKHTNDCGIACAAMIASVSYCEAWTRLAPPPINEELVDGYHQRETDFLREKGWWSSAQLRLKTVIGLHELDSIIDADDQFREAVDKSQRVRLILAFADGAKPDHAVVWDRDHKDVIFDPSRGVVYVCDLLNDAGPQTYSGTLGLTAFCYQPEHPIQPLVKTEVED